MTTYSTGTISVGSGSTTVTGSGTAWTTSGVRAGDMFTAAGLTVPIASVDSATQITLARGWPGSTQSSVNYDILMVDDGVRTLTAANALLQALTGGTLTSLAGLAGVANKLPYFSGNNTMALTDLTSWARSLLDDADVAAFWTTIGATAGAAQAFRRGNILGTVAQSAGVPTGALIESGSNANGYYERHASGLQICWHVTTVTALTITNGFMGGFRSNGQNWSFPAAFAASPAMGGYVVGATAFGVVAHSNPSTATGTFAFTSVTSQGAADRTLHLMAVGPWF